MPRLDAEMWMWLESGLTRSCYRTRCLLHYPFYLRRWAPEPKPSHRASYNTGVVESEYEHAFAVIDGEVDTPGTHRSRQQHLHRLGRDPQVPTAARSQPHMNKD